MALSWTIIHDAELSRILSTPVNLGFPPSILCPRCKAPIKLGVRKTSFLYRCGKDACKGKTINIFSKSSSPFSVYSKRGLIYSAPSRDCFSQNPEDNNYLARKNSLEPKLSIIFYWLSINFFLILDDPNPNEKCRFAYLIYLRYLRVENLYKKMKEID